MIELTSDNKQFSMLLVTVSCKLLMYMKHKISLSTAPCDTQLKSDFQIYTSPSAMFMCLSLLYPVVLVCATLSNVLRKSKIDLAFANTC